MTLERKIAVQDPVLVAVEQLGSETLEPLGYRMAHLEWSQQGHARVLRVYLERLDEAPVGLEDCSQASRALEMALEKDDPIGCSYTLEVSSPGVNRPLTRQRDFAQNLGRVVRIDCLHPVAGRKHFHGRLQDLAEDHVSIEIDRRAFQVPFTEMKRAKLDYFASEKQK